MSVQWRTFSWQRFVLYLQSGSITVMSDSTMVLVKGMPVRTSSTVRAALCINISPCIEKHINGYCVMTCNVQNNALAYFFYSSSFLSYYHFSINDFVRVRLSVHFFVIIGLFSVLSYLLQTLSDHSFDLLLRHQGNRCPLCLLPPIVSKYY